MELKDPGHARLPTLCLETAQPLPYSLVNVDLASPSEQEHMYGGLIHLATGLSSLNGLHRIMSKVSGRF